MAHLFDRLRGEAATVYRIVRSYPSTLVWPLLLLGLVLGLGIWGVNHVAKAEERRNKEEAFSLTVSVAEFVSAKIMVAISPMPLIAAMVQYNPQYTAVQSMFASLAPTLFAQAPSQMTQSIEYLPNGIVRGVYPLRGNEAAVGVNIFDPASGHQQEIIEMVRKNTTTLLGPISFVQGGHGFIAYTPIFISGAEPNETFNIPDPLDTVCGAPCSYNSTSRTKFWGIASALVNFDALREAITARLAALGSLGFRYEIGVLDFAIDTVIASSSTPPSEPVHVTIPIADRKIAIYVSPAGGWKSAAYDSLLAGLIVLAVALALLMFAALVSRKRHQMLLEALLPKELIKDLHDTDTTLLDARILQTETTADLMLSLLNHLLEGHMPDLRDVVFIRQAIIRGVDLYQPTDLRQHIQNANLDKDVARSLMQQLGQETTRNSFFSASYDTFYDGDPYTISPPLVGSFGINGSCRQEHRQQQTNQQPQQGYATLTGALALILAPHPANLRDTSMSGDTVETAAVQLLPRDMDTANVVGGAGSSTIAAGVVTSSPRPSNFMSRAMTFLRDGGGGANGAAATTIIGRVSMDLSTPQDHELSAAAAAPAAAAAAAAAAATHQSPPLSGDVPTTAAEAVLHPQPPMRQRQLMSMADFPVRALAELDDDGEQLRSSAASATAAIASSRDDCHVGHITGARVRRPPRKVASALGPGSVASGSAVIRRRSLILSLTNPQSCGPAVSGGGMLLSVAPVVPQGAAAAAATPNSARRVSVASTFDGGMVLAHDTAAAGASGEQSAVPNRPMVLLGASRRNLAAGPSRAAPKPPHHLQQPPPLPPPVLEEVERVLAQADSWHFDAWRLRDITNGHPLSALGFYLIHRAGLIEKLNLKPSPLARLLRHIEAGYNDNPYHNATHAADVLQTLHVIIHGAQLHVHYVDYLGLLAAYFAAIVHDYGHPGLTNDFLVATSDPLAVRYNDRSPLENHHAAAAFSLLQRPGLDVLAPFSKQERATFRKQVIDMVLATDVKQHFTLLSQFNTAHRLASFVHSPATAKANTSSRLSGNIHLEIVVDVGADCRHLAPKPLDETERVLSLQLAIKAADLGHLGEELEVHQRWLSSLEEEFFRQGDRERQLGIPISPLFDRSKQGVSKSQVGFYDFLALPLVHALCSAFPGTQQLMNCFLGNYHFWKSVEGNGTVTHAAPKLPVSISPVRPGPPISPLVDLEKGKGS
ncbi:hypothetical protein VaNZ11_003401 [Volvox africanus]|uniref:Phosphodiesterase n=1 Tax=Volvox africanus TaxID=51714 RepID=A0ABQ5RU38_9CHLO|nr:hypothetical protein VaNZ11_003401 [Volvox africanus]